MSCGWFGRGLDGCAGPRRVLHEARQDVCDAAEDLGGRGSEVVGFEEVVNEFRVVHEVAHRFQDEHAMPQRKVGLEHPDEYRQYHLHLIDEVVPVVEQQHTADAHEAKYFGKFVGRS